MPRRSKRPGSHRRCSAQTALLTILAMAVSAAFAPSALAAPLTPERYAGVDSVYQALMDVGGDETSLAVALAPARKACAALDTSDPLLKAMRAQCAPLFKWFLRDHPTCSNGTHCLREFRAVRRLTEDVIAKSRAFNQAVARYVGTKRCRTFLRSDAREIRGYEALVRAYRRVEAALVAKDESRIRDAIRKYKKVPLYGNDDVGDKKFPEECAATA